MALALLDADARAARDDAERRSSRRPDPSWGFVAERYPGALVDLLQADGGFVRDGAWYSAAYLLVGLALLFLLGARRTARARRHAPEGAARVAGALSVVAIPIFSAFRLELVCVPMAAFGLGLAAERLAERAAAPRLAADAGSAARPVPDLAEGLARARPRA